ncbi:MAG: carboxypeptidase regulatory-like domain-containing protein, partial [Ignavibacteriae bacterium]|nr:carboxypeptidase regulatory-like domain-containing protein [Ignavibacteriota bacterium]
MRHITIMFVVLFIVCQLPAQFVKRTAQHQPKQMQFKSNARGMVNDIQFSTSVNGPFREPDTIFVNDSLFMKMDVSPLDTIMTEYWLDANQNGILDTTDFNFEGDMLIDNGIGSSDIADLDTTSGIIIAYLNPENPPSMQIIVKAMEDSTIAYGVLVFRNAPAEFMLSGTVYERSNGPVAGLFVRAEDSTRQKMTTTDVSGHYELHLDSGTYRISVTDMFERYTSFDTTMTVQNNVTKDFYVARYTSYISGFVRDEHGTPIPQVGVGLERRNGGGGVQTNSNGYYKMMVLAGSGRIGLSQDDLLPEYMRPEGHDFTLAEGDSIVNDSISNFTCYSTNAFIYGYVFDNEGMPMRSYQIGGWANPLNSYTETHSNGLGMFSLPVRSDTDLNITYQVWLNSENENYPFPPATYADTSYWNVLPGENISFHIIPAETLALDNFNGHYIPPSSSLWDMYGHNNPWGSEAKVMVIDSTLHIRAHSQSGRSGVGVVSRKPYNLKDRDIRVVMNRTELGQKNSAFILLSDERRTWSAPDDFQNWLQLWTGDQGDPGWKLVENVDHTKHVLWETNETAGSDIRFVFEGSST